MKRTVPSAVIFDQDGTLVHSEPLWPEIDARFFSQLLGEEGWQRWEPKWLDMRRRGAQMDEMLGHLRTVFGLLLTVEGIKHARENALIAAYANRLVACEGAQEAIRYCTLHGLPVAIASGMSVRIIRSVCELMQWSSFISVIASTHETKKNKPDPSVYALAAQRLGVDPSACLAFDNEMNGYQAAVRAGMTCIAVPDTEERRVEFLSRDIPCESSLFSVAKFC